MLLSLNSECFWCFSTDAKMLVSLSLISLYLSSLSLYLRHHRYPPPHPRSQLNKLTNSSGAGESEGPLRQEGCPGQTFQVSALLSHLQDASAPRSDIMLQPYLSSWDELVRWEHAHRSTA